jgi:hypothetical protein
MQWPTQHGLYAEIAIAKEKSHRPPPTAIGDGDWLDTLDEKDGAWGAVARSQEIADKRKRPEERMTGRWNYCVRVKDGRWIRHVGDTMMMLMLWVDGCARW